MLKVIWKITIISTYFIGCSCNMNGNTIVLSHEHQMILKLSSHRKVLS